MPTYSTEFKDNVVRKMMPPNSQSVEQVGQELGLSRSTLYAWKQQYRAKGHLVPATPQTLINGTPNQSWPPLFILL